MADETSRRYLFVAIDRATRWVFVRVYNNKTAANARRFLRDLERACPPLGTLQMQCPTGQ
jgi:transposase-like protein